VHELETEGMRGGTFRRASQRATINSESEPESGCRQMPATGLLKRF
jgi:hypothetical protein